MYGFSFSFRLLDTLNCHVPALQLRTSPRYTVWNWTSCVLFAPMNITLHSTFLSVCLPLHHHQDHPALLLVSPVPLLNLHCLLHRWLTGVYQQNSLGNSECNISSRESCCQILPQCCSKSAFFPLAVLVPMATVKEIDNLTLSGMWTEQISFKTVTVTTLVALVL